MNKYDNLISIGYICDIAFYIHETSKNWKEYPFDFMWTPMKSICQVVENDFEDFVSSENLVTKVLGTINHKKWPYDAKYDIILDDPKIATFPSAYKKYRNYLDRAISNFLEKMNSNETILFIRHEECTHDTSDLFNWGDKLNNNKGNDQHDEYYYVKKFSKLLQKKYPQLKFQILFLNSREKKFVDVHHNIIGIPGPCLDECDWRNNQSGKDLKKYLVPYMPYINRALNKAIN